MARIRNGILGGFSGKVGEVIGQNYQGLSTMRAMPKYVSNPKTPAQIEHRRKVALLGNFLQPLKKVLNLSTYGGNLIYNGYNKAFKSNLSNIVVENGVAVFNDLESIDLGTYYGDVFQDMVYNFKQGIDKYTFDVSLVWNPVTYSRQTFDTDRPIMFLLEQLAPKIYTIVYADLLECQRSWGSYEFSLTLPFEFDQNTNFVISFAYTVYNVPAIDGNQNRLHINKNLRAIDWGDYADYLRTRYEHSRCKQIYDDYNMNRYNKAVPDAIIHIPSN